MKKAIYALSADPVTNGHLNIIKRASTMFDNLIIAVGNNAKKNYLFDLTKRVEFIETAIKPLNIESNIEVIGFSGALADIAYEKGANIIVRGLRNVNDFQEEQILANVNKSLNSELETCFILTELEHSFVSSSASKEIIKTFNFGDEYLPLSSKTALQSKLNEQFFIGITGLMGSGKSYIAEKLESYNPTEIFNIDLDKLCHEVYEENSEKFERERLKLKKHFGTLDRKIIGEKVFSNPSDLKFLNEVFKPVIKYQVRQSTKNKKGIFLINGATIVSLGLLKEICNNNLVMINAKDEVRHKRCQEFRNIKPEIVKARDEMMLPYNKQKEIVLKSIEENNFGNLIEFNNDQDFADIKELTQLIKKAVVKKF